MANSKKITLTHEVKALQDIFKKTISTLRGLEKEHDLLIKKVSENK